MNNRRSYLDSINAGRRRRPSTSLEQLNETLNELESRIRRPSEFRESGRSSDRDRPFRDAPHDEAIERRWDELSRRAAPRTDERMVDELRSLREEVRTQMTTGLRREFAALRDEIEHALRGSGNSQHAAELRAEFERLSGMIHHLAEQSDDRHINLLRQEMEEVKGALGKLAREETIQSFDRRWDEFDRRWNDIAQKFTAPQRNPADDAALQALSMRVDEIAGLIERLPSSVTLRSLEEKMKILSSAVDQFTHQQDRISSEALEAIEERLNEISRAVAATAVTANSVSFDPEPFERIEARISSLARQLGSVVEDNPANALASQLADLGHRVEEIARRVDMPDEIVNRLAGQIDIISRKLDETPAGPDLDAVFEGIDRRFATLAAMLEQRHEDAQEQGQALFRDLERRLGDVTSRLSERETNANFVQSEHLLQAMDDRFAELASRLERQQVAAQPAPGVDPELIRSLEAQIAGLASQISSPDLSQINPRLDRIEDTIEENRRLVVEAARLAAEEAVRNIAPTSAANDAVIASLTDDLKTLEALARRSEDRNTKTFEAIHDTLLKIVDRLSMLEAAHEGGNGEQRERVRAAIAETPAFAPVEEELALEPAVAVAAAAKASAAIQAAREEAVAKDTGKKSVLSSLTKALGRKGGKDEADIAEPSPTAVMEQQFAAPTVEIDAAIDPRIVNEPLAPGSGAPDLNAIMKRVRGNKGGTGSAADNEIAKADFIAAARRAAQAAAAEAGNTAKAAAAEKPAKEGSAVSRILGRSRKPLLMGVALLAITVLALQIGKNFMGGGEVVDQAAYESEDAFQANVPAEGTDNAEAAGTPTINRELPVEGSVAAIPERAETTVEPVAEAPKQDEMAWLDPNASQPMPGPVAVAAQPVEEIDIPAEPTEEQLAAIPDAIGPVALREAAASGDPKALFEIGSRYAEGRGVPADMAEAAKWYEQAADAGLAPAQYRIGNLYEKGIGVERDVARAKTWYQLAAAQGNASAMHNLAVLFAMGADGVSDHESAARWFLEAAELGVRDSQFNLGILAAKGVGMKQNLEDAYKWFDIVARQGDKDAAEKRDEVAKVMKPEALERARNSAELWQQRQIDPEANTVEIPESWTTGHETTASIDMKQAVRNIQRILNLQGFDAGVEDGVMGQRTKDAIKAFQKANGIQPTGEVDEPLVRALLAKRDAKGA